MRISKTAVAVAAIAIATCGVVPAHAADGGAEECLERLVTGGVGSPMYAIAKPNATMPLATAPYNPPACVSVVAVSIGISRPDGSDFRNANAVKRQWYGTASYWGRTASFTSKDAGDWIYRQIVVKDDQGRIAGRSYTPSYTFDRFQIRAGVVISSRQRGVLHAGADGRVTISGDLKAYNSHGGLSPLPAGQRLAVEVWDPRTGYWTAGYLGTSSSGWYRGYPAIGRYHGSNVRLAYYSPYRTIAGGFGFVGRIA